jgi:hypothetical protein
VSVVVLVTQLGAHLTLLSTNAVTFSNNIWQIFKKTLMHKNVDAIAVINHHALHLLVTDHKAQ